MGDPAAGYIHLDTISGFSFRRGASHPEALVERAAELGYEALALTDVNGPYGAPRFLRAARAADLRPIVGATVRVEPGGRLVLLVEDASGWANLCRLLSAANLAGTKERPRLTLPTLALHAAGLVALAGPATLVAARLLAGDGPGAAAALAELAGVFPGRLWLELVDHHTPADWRRNHLLAELGRSAGVGAVATNMVQYAAPEDGPVHDVLACLREHTTLAEAGLALAPNREAYLKSQAEMAALFGWCPGALANAGRIAERCAFAPAALDGRLPPFPVPPGETAFSHLHRLATDGARERYRPLSPAAARQLAHELEVIERLGFADYFLIVADLCREARARGILCQGRGSAANSVVAYALGITNVDPVGLGLLFERFLSDDRIGMPDIDVDFANDRREEIIQYAYDRYGRDRCAMVAEYICYRERLAAREVGRALGLPPARLTAFARDLAGAMGAPPADAPGSDDEAGNDGEPPAGATVPHEVVGRPIPLRIGAEATPPEAGGPAASAGLTCRLAEVAARMADLPRHLGIHSGGLVLTARPLVDLVPIERARLDGRTVIPWDKDDAEAMGLAKIDLLALGMLSLLGRCLRLIKQTRGVDLDLGRLRPDDAAVFALLQRADTVGVFQVESRAQMNLAPRLKPKTFYDLVISVALIRPGPILGASVHPYLRRRAGVEPVSYPHPLAAPILERTLGVPLF